MYESPAVTLVGLGRLQLGLVAPTFHMLGYRLIAVNLKDENVVKKLRKFGYFNIIFDINSNTSREISIDKAYYYQESENNSNEIISEAAYSKIINFGLGQDLHSVTAAAKFLLAVEQFRREKGIITKIFITCSDNPVGSTFGVDAIRNKLIHLTLELDDLERYKLWNDLSYHVRFIRTLGDKICTKRIIPYREVEPLKVISEEFGSIIFEESFSDSQPLLLDVSKAKGLTTSTNMDFERKKKFYTINMAHSIIAYLSMLLPNRPTYIHEAIQIPSINMSVRHALEEVSKALSSSSEQSPAELKEYGRNVYERLCNPNISDEIVRIARDVPRKLTINDRLLGPLVLIYEELFRIDENILNSIAASLVYTTLYDKIYDNSEEDIETKQLQKNIGDKGVESVLFDLLELGQTKNDHLVILQEKIANRYYFLLEETK